MLLNLPVHQQPPTKSPVTTLMVYLTEDCNLRCTYCFVAKKKRSMTSETASKVVDFFLSPAVSGQARDLQLNFFGGEPFLDLDRMDEIVERASRLARSAGRRVYFSATTNGTILSDRIERRLRESSFALLLSLDGGPEITREDRPFVGGRSSHELVVKNFPRFLEATSGRVMVRTTFHPSAMRLVERLEYLLSLGAPSVFLCPVLDADWESSVHELNREYQELATWFLARCRAGEAPALEATWMLLRQWHSFFLGAARPDRPCPVGKDLMAVDPDGNVLPCHRFLYRRQDWLGTVEAPNLAGRQPYLELHSSLLPPDCNECPAQPVCGGGCRLVALQRGLGLHDIYSGFCIPMRAHALAAFRIYRELAAEGLLERVLGFTSPVGSSLQEIFAGER